MNRCNRCTIRSLEKLAEDAGGHVVISCKPHIDPTSDEVAEARKANGGYEIYIKYPNQPEPVWAAWIMGLGPHCAC